MARREFQMPSVLRQDGPRPYWYIRYRRKALVGKDRIERREIWHRLGYCDEMTKREACRVREEVLHEVNREVYTIQSQIPIEDFVKVYQQQHLVTLAPGGRKRDISLLDNHILPAFSGTRLCDVGTEDLQSLLNQKFAEGLSWWTRRAMKAVVSSIFVKAGDWGYWEGRNPATRVSIGRKRLKRERRILSDDHFRLLLAALPEDVRLMVETAGSTGMRVSELLALRWRSVNLDQGSVRVEQRYYRGDTDEPKSDRSRRVLPLGYLANAYRGRRPLNVSLDAYVFERDGEPLDDRELLRDVIRPAAERLGIYFPGFGWHTFRRQNLTLIQEEGATSFEAQEQAGHSRPSMTSEYTIVGFARRERAVRRVQERLLGIEITKSVN
jgi:integrase